MSLEVTVTKLTGLGPRWVVTADEDGRTWSDSYWRRQDAESMAADIEQGLIDPWDEDE